MIYFTPDTSSPTRVTAVQGGITSIIVTWNASSDATGYRIHYASYSDSESVDIAGGNTISHTLVGLTNGEIYTISIVGRASSPGPPRAPVVIENVALCKF